MRDRLIELCKSYVHDCHNPCEKELASCTNCVYEQLADYLLDNGVIVPPCKVGDILYYIPFGSTITKWEIRSIEIIQDDIVFHCGRIFFLKHDIGKTVFLTREAAENALRKEDEGK